MVIDPSSPLGQVRLRISDWSDIPLLPDTVINNAIAEANGNLPQAAKVCATFILGLLSFRTHRKMAQLEVWGSEAFAQYKEYLMLIVKDPAFMTTSPIPYAATADFSPIVDFQENWNKAYYNTTEAQQLARISDRSPNSGGRIGYWTIP